MRQSGGGLNGSCRTIGAVRKITPSAIREAIATDGDTWRGGPSITLWWSLEAVYLSSPISALTAISASTSDDAAPRAWWVTTCLLAYPIRVEP